MGSMAGSTAVTVTLNVTGRDIVSALRAGKTVMVHSVVDGYDEYSQPYDISFSESEDKFYMTVKIYGGTFDFNGTLDGPLTASSGSGEETIV